MLRPIDVVFKHPVKKFTVIYQNGHLWQLPGLSFTGKSLLLKKPYTGSREQIFVAKNQTLDSNDELLQAQLLTLPLPQSVSGLNVNEFEAWWTTNGYLYQEQINAQRQHRKQIRKRVIQAYYSKPKPTPSASPTSTINKSTGTITQTISEADTQDNSTDDIFDKMLAELIKNLR